MERRDLYDEHKKKTGETIEKGSPIPKGKYYITVVVWMQNSDEKFLIQKTSPTKGHKWATTGGHPKAGESSLQGIVTEIKEELGITVNSNNLKLIKTIKTEDDFIDIYYVMCNIKINDIKLQEDEVEEVKWATQSEIEALIKKGDFLQSHINFYKVCLKYLNDSKSEI